MRLCLILWVLADKALTHITPSSNDHNQSIITEQGGGGEEVGKAKEKRRKASNSGVPPPPHTPLFCSSLLSSSLLGRWLKLAGRERTVGLTELSVTTSVFFHPTLFPSRTYTHKHKHTHTQTHTNTLSLSLSLSPLPSALGLHEMRHQTTAFLSKLSQPAYKLWSDCPMSSKSPRTPPLILCAHVHVPTCCVF